MHKLFLILSLAALMLAALAVPAGALGAQIWYLDQVGHSRSGKVMEKIRGEQAGVITILPGSVQYWLTDQASQADVTYPQGAWIIGLKTDGYWGDTTSDKAILNLGEWDVQTSSFVGFPTFTQSRQTWSNGKNILRVEMQTRSLTVHKGNYLALKVSNLDGMNHMVITNGSSYIESSTSDPGYPLPESASAILLGAGLVGLVGYLATRKLKINSHKPRG